MSSSSESPDRITLPIFSVCADLALSAAAIAVASERSGAEFVGEFHDYITAGTRPKFADVVTSAPACVALVDFDRNPALALETAERLREIFLAKISIVAIASQLDAELAVGAMRSGCSEYLKKPLDPSSLSSALARFQATSRVDMPTPRAGKAIALIGTKGGVGTTTLAVHLAMHLVHTHAKKVLLIDAHYELGHVALYLGMKEFQYSFNDVMRNAERLDAEMLSGFIVRHSSGLSVIASPDKRIAPQPRNEDDLHRVLAVLRREYDVVLIDVPFPDEQGRPSVLDHADQAYLVTTTDIGALRNLSRHVEHMELGEAEKDRVHIVLNRSVNTDPVTPEQIQATIGIAVAARHPDAHSDLYQAVNRGEPLSPQSKSEFSKQVADWACRVLGTDARRSQPKSVSSRLAFWR